MTSTAPNSRTLRKITLATLLPGFPLLIAAGIGSALHHRHYYYDRGPTTILFGLLPSIFSALTSAWALVPKRVALEKAPKTWLWCLVDALLAAGYLGVLVPVWVFDPPALNADWMMLETYATFALLANMLIHAYLALWRPVTALAGLLRFGAVRSECPHCHGRLGVVETGERKTRGGYSLLRAEEYMDEEPGAEASTGVIRASADV